MQGSGFIFIWECVCAVEAKNTGTSDFWIENSATWGKNGPGTVTDEVICRTGVTVIGNWKEFAVTVNSWWRKIPTIPGYFMLLK